MPLIVIDRVVIDPLRRAEGLAAVGAAHEHLISPVTLAVWQHASQHVNVIVRARAGTVDRQEYLS
jgi:hypothetical protein